MDAFPVELQRQRRIMRRGERSGGKGRRVEVEIGAERQRRLLAEWRRRPAAAFRGKEGLIAEQRHRQRIEVELVERQRAGDMRQPILAIDIDVAGHRRLVDGAAEPAQYQDRKSTRLNSSHTVISYAVFCLKKKNHAGCIIDIKKLL